MLAQTVSPTELEALRRDLRSRMAFVRASATAPGPAAEEEPPAPDEPPEDEGPGEQRPPIWTPGGEV
jgi:hypothetical protein